MKKLALFLLLTIYPFLFIQAQNLTISGQITDQSKHALIGANVILLQLKDSSFIKGTITDLDGNFIIEGNKPGKKLIKISFIGYEDIFITKVLTNQSVSLGKLILKEKTTRLDEVKITSSIVQVQQKGDTTEVNAGAFKTNPDANAEDLVTKMPGITVQDGKVQAHGEDVQKVLVDGKDFFGEDANAVLKNLPAEVIDKIQIFDKKSDQSELTGFDDGNTAKTLNIVTKQKFRNGIFGKVNGGYGYEDKWKGGLSINFFKDKRRITILENSNNVNEQNFSSEDLLGVMSGNSGAGSSGRRSGGGGGGFGGGGRPGGQMNDAGNFLVDQKSGITKTHAFGVNYADQWKKVSFTGSYFLNYSDNNSVNDIFRQYITTQNEGLTYNETNNNNSKNINHRLNLKFDWKIDTLNSILFQPKFSLQQNDAASTLFGENAYLTNAISSTSDNFTSHLTGINFSSPLLYRHSFNKKRRTISLSITPGYNQNSGKNNLSSYSTFFADTLSADTLKQLANRDVQGFTLSSNIAYTEPISEKGQLMFNYGTNFNKNESNKETFNFSPVDNSYNSFDTILSNKYSSQYFSQSFGTSYRLQDKQWNLSAGVSYQFAQLKGEQIFPDSFNLSKSFSSILPNIQFQYKFSAKKNLRINYRSTNNAPSVSQLQNVINNSNSLQLTTGNPNLNQDWRNNITIRYASSNTEKLTSFFALLSGIYTQNYIVNNTFIASKDTLIAPGITLARGSQLSKPINLDGYFNVRSFNNYSFPISKLKLNFSFNLGGAYSRTPGIVNNKLNYANSYNAGLGITISSNISENFDFTISSNTTYNNISNTLQTDLNSVYYNQTTKLKVQVMPWKGLVLQTDLNHQYNIGLSNNYNQKYLLWNAAVGYKFLKDRLAEFRLSIFDIMKQNNSITRNTTETYYEDVKTNVLQQYLLLTFTYNLKYFKDSNSHK